MDKRVIPGFFLIMSIVLLVAFLAPNPVNSVQLTTGSQVKIVYSRPELYNITSYGSGSIWIWPYIYVIRGAQVNVNESLQVNNVLVGVYCAYAELLCVCNVNVYLYDNNGNLLSSGRQLTLLGSGEFGVVNVTLSNPASLENIYEIRITP